MGAGVTQQGPDLRRSTGSVVQMNADNDLLHVRHYARVNEYALGPRLGQEMGQGAPQIPADLYVVRPREFRLKPSST
jgi:hypothetical protein